MTPEQIAEIRATLYNAMVESGPWRHSPDDPEKVLDRDGWVVADCSGRTGLSYETANFVIDVSTALPQALDTIEAQAAEIARLRRVLESDVASSEDVLGALASRQPYVHYKGKRAGKLCDAVLESGGTPMVVYVRMADGVVKVRPKAEWDETVDCPWLHKQVPRYRPAPTRKELEKGATLGHTSRGPNGEYGITVKTPRDLMLNWSSMVVDLWETTGAVNWFEQVIHHPSGDFVLNLQREAGERPSWQIEALKKRLSQAEELGSNLAGAGKALMLRMVALAEKFPDIGDLDPEVADMLDMYCAIEDWRRVYPPSPDLAGEG